MASPLCDIPETMLLSSKDCPTKCTQISASETCVLYKSTDSNLCTKSSDKNGPCFNEPAIINNGDQCQLSFQCPNLGARSDNINKTDATFWAFYAASPVISTEARFVGGPIDRIGILNGPAFKSVKSLCVSILTLCQKNSSCS